MEGEAGGALSLLAQSASDVRRVAFFGLSEGGVPNPGRPQHAFAGCDAGDFTERFDAWRSVFVARRVNGTVTVPKQKRETSPGRADARPNGSRHQEGGLSH